MSEQGKEQMGQAFTWIFRALTGLGAFFLIQTYNGIRISNELLYDIRVNQVRMDQRMEQHEMDIARHERHIDEIRSEQATTKRLTSPRK